MRPRQSTRAQVIIVMEQILWLLDSVDTGVHYLRAGWTNLRSFQVYFCLFVKKKKNISYDMYFPSIT